MVHNTTALNWRISGYKIYHLNATKNTRGLTAIIKNNIPHTVLNPPDTGYRNETQHIQITVNKTTLHIFNVYKNHHGPAFKLLPLLQHCEHNKVVITGDFNAHSTEWGSNKNSKEGTHISNTLLNSGQATILNNGSFTTRWETAIDLTIVSNDIAAQSNWETIPSLFIDHIAHLTTIFFENNQDDTPTNNNWFNINKADWSEFKNELDKQLINSTQLNDVNLEHERICNIIITAANKTIPKSNRHFKQQSKWYHNDEVREANHKLNTLTKTYRKHPYEHTLREVRKQRNKVRQVAKEAQNTAWQEWIDTLDHTTKLKDMWGKIKAVAGKVKSRPNYADPDNEAKTLIKEYIQRSSDSNLTPDIVTARDKHSTARMNRYTKATKETDELNDQKFTFDELQRVIKKLKKSAPGTDNISNTMLKHVSKLTIKTLLDLFNNIWQNRHMVENWLLSDLVPIPKPGQPGKTRPIALLLCTAKLNERLVTNRLKHTLAPALDKHLFGYIKHKSTHDAIGSLLDITTSHPKRSIICFVDFEKAFETANRLAILDTLAEYKVKGNTVSFIANYLENRQARVKIGDIKSEYNTFQNGTPQGSVLSPTIFNVLVNKVVTNIAKYSDSTVLSYADDLAIITTGGCADAKMKMALNELDSITKKLGLKVNKIKTEIMDLTGADTQFNIGETTLNKVTAYTYLGITIDRKHTFRPHIDKLIDRLKKRLNVMRALSGILKGPRAKTLKLFYTAVIQSTIDYSSTYTILASNTQKDRIQKIQNQALRLILGAPNWAKIYNMQREVNITCVTYRAKENCTILAAKILQNPDHILHDKLKTKLANFVHSDTSWLNRIANIFCLEMESEIDIAPEQYQEYHPTYNPLPLIVKTDIIGAKSKHTIAELKHITQTHINQACTNTQNTGPPLVYYTDGSIQEDGTAGSAMHCPSLNINERIRVSDHPSTTQTELIAIALALTHALEHLKHRVTDVIIISDSMAAIDEINNTDPTINRSIIYEIHKAIFQIKTKARIVLMWIPSHIDIKGNDKADHNAKLACNIPYIGVTLTPTLTQIKQIVKRNSRKRYFNCIAIEDRLSPSFKWYKNATIKPFDMKINMSRHAQTQIFRARLHYKIITQEGITCRYCQAEHIVPTIHTLAECPASNTLRDKMLQHLKPEETSLIPEALTHAILKNQEKRKFAELQTMLTKFPIQYKN